MESGFCPAWTSITFVNECGSCVRHYQSTLNLQLMPVEGLSDDKQAKDQKDEEADGDGENEWEKLAQKYEALESKVAEYFDNEDKTRGETPPVIPFPPGMDKEEWEAHQTTHTPWSHH